MVKMNVRNSDSCVEEVLIRELFVVVDPADFVSLFNRTRKINSLLPSVNSLRFKELLRDFIKDVLGIDIAVKDWSVDDYFRDLTRDEKYIFSLFLELSHRLYCSEYYLVDYVHSSIVLKFSTILYRLRDSV